MKDNKELNQGRRDLLKGLTAATVAGSIVTATTGVANASESIDPSEETSAKPGYHETQHILDYYNTL